MTVTSVFAPARAAAAAGQQADPVRRRRAGRGGQGLGRGHRALGADVPGRLRGRPAQPGRADPLRGAQRAARRARRAHVRGLAGPRDADARARRAAVHRRRAPAGRRVRPVRHLVRHRAGLHQPADRARPGRHPAAGRRPRPTTTRSCVAGGHAAFNPEPIADFIDAAVLGDGEEAVLEITDDRPGVEGRGLPGRPRRAAAAPGPHRERLRAALLRRRLPARRPDPAGRAQPRRTCRSGCTSARRWTSTRGRTRRSRWCRWPRRCTSGTRWRSSAAAPAAAGSARPA